MTTRVLNFPKNRGQTGLEDMSEEKYHERVIWNIYNLPKNLSKKIDNSQYRKIKDSLYMINDELNLIFKIKHEKSKKKTCDVDLYDLGEEWLSGVPVRKGDFYETRDVIYNYFGLYYLTHTEERNIIGIVVEKPYKIIRKHIKE